MKKIPITMVRSRELVECPLRRFLISPELCKQCTFFEGREEERYIYGSKDFIKCGGDD